MTASVSIGPLHNQHRRHIEDIVRATGVFSEDEVGVALELFDEAAGALVATSGGGVGSEGTTAPDYEFIGAFAGDRVIGYACFGATPSTDRTFDLYWIAVHPDAQGTGAGSSLMAEVERRLDERRARLVVVETSSRDDYAPTRHFYRKRGYVEAARLRDFYAPGNDRVILSKRLTGFNDPGGNAAVRPLPSQAYE